jgi:hypothetical protein
MGGHQSAKAQTVDWLTPPAIIDALGGPDSFDLDPATPDAMPWATARSRYTRADNGLFKRWFGRVWLNPPYTDDIIGKWMARLHAHGRGCALIFARTETEMFFRHVWGGAAALLFLKGRLHFHYPDGRRAARNAGAPSVLCAYGQPDAEMLADCGLHGRFVPLVLPRAVLVLGIPATWADIVAAQFARARGPVSIDDLYRAVMRHPRWADKAAANRHVRAKLRQQLQKGPYKRVARGMWERA